MRDSMVLYRSFIDSILKLETQFNAETALKLFKAVAKYGLDGVVDDDMDPLIDLLFTNIKPQIDANTKRFVNGKKGGRPKKTKGNADTEPKVIDNKTIGYESKNHRLLDDKTIGYENENLRLSDKKPNDNVNDNVNVNLNVNKKVYPPIENSDTKGLEEIQKEALKIVYKHFKEIGCKENDCLVYTQEDMMESKKTDQRIANKMKELNSVFFHWIYSQHITNLAKLQIYIKVIRRQNFESAYEYFNPAIEFINKAITNNWKNLYFDDIKK
jgi:hypothetical protein